MTNFTPWSALAGGALIGVSASLLLSLDGRIAGISGILGGIVRPRGGVSELSWRALFLLGLLVGGALLLVLRPSALAFGASEGMPSLGHAAIAGVLVGYGTRLGGGCTSGHGVCGISRFSRRSIVATITFMATGVLATFIVRHVLSPGAP